MGALAIRLRDVSGGGYAVEVSVGSVSPRLSFAWIVAGLACRMAVAVVG